jgi:hypothetical protein
LEYVASEFYTERNVGCAREDYIMRSFMKCMLHHMLLGWLNQEDEMEYVTHMGNEKWLENLTGRDHLEDIGIEGRVISEWILGK